MLTEGKTSKIHGEKEPDTSAGKQGPDYHYVMELEESSKNVTGSDYTDTDGNNIDTDYIKSTLTKLANKTSTNVIKDTRQDNTSAAKQGPDQHYVMELEESSTNVTGRDYKDGNNIDKTLTKLANKTSTYVIKDTRGKDDEEHKKDNKDKKRKKQKKKKKLKRKKHHKKTKPVKRENKDKNDDKHRKDKKEKKGKKDKTNQKDNKDTDMGKRYSNFDKLAKLILMVFKYYWLFV